MKKLFLSIIAILAVSLTSFAQVTLHDAYLQIKDIPGMKIKNDQALQINGIANVNQARTASAVTDKNADRLRTRFTETIASLPSEEVIVNSGNQSEFATILVEPSDHNLFNVLILQGDALTGQFSATYGTTTAEEVDAISSSKKVIETNDLVLTPVASTTGVFISMTE